MAERGDRAVAAEHTPPPSGPSAVHSRAVVLGGWLSGITTPHKLRPEARSRKRTSRRLVVRAGHQPTAEDVSFMRWLASIERELGVGRMERAPKHICFDEMRELRGWVSLNDHANKAGSLWPCDQDC